MPAPLLTTAACCVHCDRPSQSFPDREILRLKVRVRVIIRVTMMDEGEGEGE